MNLLMSGCTWNSRNALANIVIGRTLPYPGAFPPPPRLPLPHHVFPSLAFCRVLLLGGLIAAIHDKRPAAAAKRHRRRTPAERRSVCRLCSSGPAGCLLAI